MEFRTKAVQEGVYADNQYHSATTPIYTTSTFLFERLGEMPRYDYSRSGNPTRNALQENLAALEGGTHASITCTGMSAISSAMLLFKPGDHIIADKGIYGGTYRLFHSVFTAMGFQYSFVDMTDAANVRAALRPSTKCIWIETPSNPLLGLADIAAVVAIAREAGAITIADNTFMSPYFQRPLEQGVDVVVESMTKYINGHSDVVGGALITAREDLGLRIKEIVNAIGTPASPFDSWLVLRGVKTLPYRMEGHQKHALAVAQYLESLDVVKRVFYPGLASHPQHALAKKQMSGFGGMVSFEVEEGALDLAAFVAKLVIFRLAESLGGAESLICQPWSMTHASMPEEARLAAGITPSIFRLSVGLEDPKDLVADLDTAFKAATKAAVTA